MELNSKAGMRKKMSEKILEFIVGVLKQKKFLCRTYSDKHIFDQLFRSGSSVDANYWLRLIQKSNLISENNPDLKFLLNESLTSIRIFNRSLNTARQVKV